MRALPRSLAFLAVVASTHPSAATSQATAGLSRRVAVYLAATQWLATEAQPHLWLSALRFGTCAIDADDVIHRLQFFDERQRWRRHIPAEFAGAVADWSAQPRNSVAWPRSAPLVVPVETPGSAEIHDVCLTPIGFSADSGRAVIGFNHTAGREDRGGLLLMAVDTVGAWRVVARPVGY